MKVIDLLNKIANGEEVPKKVKYKGIIFENKDGDLLNDINCSLFEHRSCEAEKLLPMLNDEVEIIEEDKFKTKVMVVDKEGNEKEYLLELGEGLKEDEKIFKANDGHWYAQKLIDEKSEFYKWLDEFEPTIYYSMEEEKKIPKKLDIQIQNETTGNAYITNEQGTKCYLTKHSKIIAERLNQVIDYLQSKGE